MKIIKKIGWFLFDVLGWIYDGILWIIKSLMRLMKKMVNRIKNIFNYENLRKNKVKIIISLIIISAISFSVWYVYKNYIILIIPKDEKKQSAVEKSYLKALKRAQEKPNDAKEQIIPKEVVAPIKRLSFRGTVKKVEEGKITIVTDKKEEKIIVLNEKTKTMPIDKKVAVDQIVTISTHMENDQPIADRISIRPEVKAKASITPIKEKSTGVVK
jgi:hypothetical protein